MLPILVVLGLMIRLSWGAHKAGPAGWLAGLAVGAVWFGLTPLLLWVSQAKGLLLSLFVLAVMWPALLLYHWIDRNHGIKALARLLEQAIANRGMCLLLLAWALSGLLEGLAGFGLPIAVVAPMLTALGVTPIRAVTAVAVGHAWAVTFGDMGVILQTLSAVVSIPVAELVPWTALLLGVACLLCGLMTAFILGHRTLWPQVVGLSFVMGTTQYILAAAGLVSLSAFGAGLLGMVAYLAAAALWRKMARIGPGCGQREKSGSASGVDMNPGQSGISGPGLAVPEEAVDTRPARLAIACYGSLTLLMAAFTMVPFLHARVQAVAWKPAFPAVTTSTGFSTPAGPGQVIRPLAHPGTLILAVALASMIAAGRAGLPRARAALIATAHSAGLASVGIVFMVGLSTLMDYCGMSYLLAQGLSATLGAAYPVLSPCVGILGAFATGSNNNSNVLFGSLQTNVATLLRIEPSLLAAAQTSGGSLGSMLAPAKIVVGCSTVEQVGQEGQVLRRTVPRGLLAGLALGLLSFIISRFR
jgi:lactate permease